RVGDLLADYGWRLVEQAGPSYFRDTYIRPTGRDVAASPLEWTALAER
ncbi:SAM-dependent methyltransferase, partial [Mycobacterium sp. ITM-2017-0098]